MKSNDDDRPEHYKTTLCKHFMNKDCFKGSNCNHAHGKEDLRPSEDSIKKYNYKTELCNSLKPGGQPCRHGKKCDYIHREDPEYAEYKARIEKGLVPIVGVTTPARIYESYAAAVWAEFATDQVHPTGDSLPTHLKDGRTTELSLIAVANGCSEKEWKQLSDDIPELYRQLKDLDDQISQWNENPLRPSYSQEIAKAKASRMEIEKNLLKIVKKKNQYLNRDIMDLHGVRHAKDAEVLVKERIGQIARDRSFLPAISLRKHTLTIITGAGNNSAGEDPLILNEVRVLLEVSFRLEMLNEGCIIVHFPREWFEA